MVALTLPVQISVIQILKSNRTNGVKLKSAASKGKVSK